MGRLHPRKGVGLLVEAFKAANLPNTRLLIVGPDEGMLDTLRPCSTNVSSLPVIWVVRIA